MTIETVYTTWTRLFGNDLNHSDFDPENIMPTGYTEACLNHQIEQCNKYLAEYGCYLYPDGEIWGREKNSEDYNDYKTFYENEFKEFVDSIDYDDIFERYA